MPKTLSLWSTLFDLSLACTKEKSPFILASKWIGLKSPTMFGLLLVLSPLLTNPCQIMWHPFLLFFLMLNQISSDFPQWKTLSKCHTKEEENKVWHGGWFRWEQTPLDKELSLKSNFNPSFYQNKSIFGDEKGEWHLSLAWRNLTQKYFWHEEIWH